MFAALLILMSVTPNCCALCGGQDALISLIRQGALTQSQTKHINTLASCHIIPSFHFGFLKS